MGISGAISAQNGWYVASQLNNANYNISGIEFVNTTDGYLTANNGSTGYIFKTTNGGTTWTQDTSFAYKLNAVDIYNGVVYVVGNSGKIFKKAANSWTSLTSGTSNDLKDIHMVSATTGYATGVSGTLRKTVNGGTSWTNPIVGTGLSYDFNSVYFTSASNGVIVGTYNFFQGFSIQTISGGQYWSVPVNMPSRLNQVTFTSTNIAYAVGNGGVIYKSTNGGSSWLLKTSGVSVELFDVSFINDSIGYVVGDNGTLLKTLNGGTSWQQQSSPLNIDYKGVWAVNDTMAWAAGDSAQVMKTMTGGLNLSVQLNDTAVYCSGYALMNPIVNYNGSNTLQYSWASSSNLSNTNTANPLAGPMSQSETFYLTVTDGTLSASDSITVSIATLPADSICLVSVLDSTNDNVIVFEKHVVGPIAYYKIYKESTVANVYDSIGFIPGDSAGIFLDTNVNPAVQAYRYKISSVDSCGNETTMSNAHKTIHLTINQGLPGQWNLIWNNYEGVFINTYRIWRADSLGVWSLIDSVAGNMTSYTDLNPSPGSIQYQVEIISSYMCLPFNYKAQTNYNTSRSNRANTGAPPTVSADFSANITQGNAPLVVQFSSAAQGTIDHYYWDFGDGDTSMLENPTHTYLSQGIYDVSLKVVSGILSDSIEKVAFIDVLSSINNTTAELDVQLFPNPASLDKMLTIKSKFTRIEKVEIFDVVGKQVYYQDQIKNREVKVSLKKAYKGIFFIKITGDDGRQTQRKLIIK